MSNIDQIDKLNHRFKLINLSKLENNTGQIPNVPQNPRDLTDDGFDKCVQSIKDAPHMLEARMLVVIPVKDKYVVIGGNQRLRALNHLKFKNTICFVADEWTNEQIIEFIIKDNLEYGITNFDVIANEYNIEQCIEWGMNVPDYFSEHNQAEDEPKNTNTEINSDDLKEDMKLTLNFSYDQYQNVTKELKKHGSTMEIGLLKLLDL
jgi:hypothetical protein